MAVLVRFSSDQEKKRAVELMLDRHFAVGEGLVISDLDEEILRQGSVKFESEKATLEVLTQ
jgi:hypothetical protein